MAAKKKKVTRSSDAGPRRIGRLFLIGGNEDKDEHSMSILPHFVEMCGKGRGRIIVCGSPSKTPQEKERKYKRIFEKIGAKEVIEASITNRQDAEKEALVEAVRRARGIFFTGGDQLRLTSLVAGTPFGEEVRRRLWTEELVVGGTSAGAAAAGSTMMIGGSDRGTVKRADVKLAPGLGYWRDATVDTHFAERGRISRVLTVFAENPQILGIGIDEDTAIDVEPGRRFTVVGSGAVFVFDGAVTHSSAPEVYDDEVIGMTDALVHVLPEGYGFDLQKKRPILPGGHRVPKRSA